MTILFIDDDPEDVEFFREAVSSFEYKYTCVFASNGLEGIKLLRSLSPDFIFIDVNMPVMGGRETLQKIRSMDRFKSLPICILSTAITPADVEDFKAIGATHCIRKANSFNRLCDSVRNFIYNNIDTPTNVPR